MNFEEWLEKNESLDWPSYNYNDVEAAWNAALNEAVKATKSIDLGDHDEACVIQEIEKLKDE